MLTKSQDKVPLSLRKTAPIQNINSAEMGNVDADAEKHKVDKSGKVSKSYATEPRKVGDEAEKSKSNWEKLRPSQEKLAISMKKSTLIRKSCRKQRRRAR